MALISLRDIKMSFGSAPVLDAVSLQIEPGERICLVGRNGEGKSTLMSIIAGDLEPLDGQIAMAPGLKLAMLCQKVPLDLHGTVFEEVARGFGQQSILLKQYHDVSRQVAADVSPELLKQLDRLHHAIEAVGAWSMHLRVETVLTHLGLESLSDTDVSVLSAGLKRRVLLAKALVCQPDILLLDEPTNHLDINSIVWLEEYLKDFAGSILFVTHDRMFVRRLSTRILDLDRGRLTSWNCGYDEYVQRKQSQLEVEEAENRHFDKKLAQEEVWIRKGIQARRTRNMGRVRELLEMRENRRRRRTLSGKIKLQANELPVSGQMMIEILGLSFAYRTAAAPSADSGGYPSSLKLQRTGSPLAGEFGVVNIVENFTATVMKGDKIGLIGPNGCGKTTLLKVLLGQLRPTDGTIRWGANLEIAYFDQLHSQLDDNKSVWENVADGYSTIVFNGKSRNVVGYLEDFLFPPRQSRSLVSTLSGGERNRLLLARLFSKPANILVLDEPTNDLDVESLELLEELLADYAGTVLLVSHDREFLNRVVTSTYVFEGNACVKEYVGGYDDWVRQKNEKLAAEQETLPPKEPKPDRKAEKRAASRLNAQKKLSYKEQKELEALPAEIERLEQERAALHAQMAEPAFYKQPQELLTQTAARLQELESALAAAFARWEQLEQ
ncbi:MAG: ATP-binding cassette domain-containing protein [Planctomycetaceae bacterium]|nr:ATP-binding cassette domain-containing protein [Planctomycetaceae bacterium]